MQGKRVEFTGALLRPGEYAMSPDGVWFCQAPRQTADGFGFTGNLAAHDVTEHEDGTITVSPSIKITRHDGVWHGYLERGIWREC